MIDTKKLLPCPFCGASNVNLLRFDGDEQSEYVIDGADELDRTDFYPYIHCYDCDIDFCPDSTATPREAIEAWNKRV